MEISMKKYYIEVVWHGSMDSYVIQSHWFDTDKQAIEWVNGISWVNDNYDVYLMYAEFNEDSTYNDILVERRLDL